MPHKKRAPNHTQRSRPAAEPPLPPQEASEGAADEVLRVAQTCLCESLEIENEQPAAALAQCTQAIQAIRDARLHEAADSTLRKEARSTLCLAYWRRSSILRLKPGAGDPSQALPDAKAALAMAACTNDKLIAQRSYLLTLTASQRYDEVPAACDALQETLARPREPMRYRFMAAPQMETQQCDQAIAQARRCYAESRAQARRDQGRALSERDQDKKAVAAYSAALDISRDAGLDASRPQIKANLLRLRAHSLSKLRRYDAATADAKLAVQLHPADVKGHILLGNILQRAGHHQAACLAFLRGAKMHPQQEHLGPLMDGLFDANFAPRAFSTSELVRSLPLSHCAVCGKFLGTLMDCKTCRSVFYCCRAHQRQDWRNHKLVCSALAAIPQDLSAGVKDDEVEALLAALPAPSSDAAARIERLQDVPTWDDFAGRVCPLRLPPGRMTQMLHRVATFPLTLAASLVAFELESLHSVRVHLLNVDAESRRCFECGAGVARLLPFPRMELLFCGISAPTGPLSSQSRAPNGRDRLSEAMSGRNQVAANTLWSPWHESDHDSAPPDLVLDFNARMHDVAYEWPATLRALVARNVPCVFTAANEREYERALEAVRAARGSLAFHGPAPFPAPFPVNRRGELHQDNLFWVAFWGGGL